MERLGAFLKHDNDDDAVMKSGFLIEGSGEEEKRKRIREC